MTAAMMMTKAGFFQRWEKRLMRCVRALELLSTPQKTNSEKNAVKKYSGFSWYWNRLRMASDFQEEEAQRHGKQTGNEDLVDHISVEDGLIAALGRLFHVILERRFARKGQAAQRIHNHIDP